MQKKIIVVIIGIVLLASAWFGTAYAQEDPGYPVDTETPTETEVPTKPPEDTPTPPPPTSDPTQPPQPSPTEAPPTWVPTQPSPTPSETPVVEFPACPFSHIPPILYLIAERYNVPFEEVADMFCSMHMGVGEIIRYFDDLQHPNGGVGFGIPVNFPGSNGRGWGLFWRVFNLIGSHGNHHWEGLS